MEHIKITNIENNLCISELLEKIADSSKNSTNLTFVEKEQSSLDDKKCEITTTILLGVATGVAASGIYDLIKTIVKNTISKHPEFRGDLKLKINNAALTINDILKK